MSQSPQSSNSSTVPLDRRPTMPPVTELEMSAAIRVIETVELLENILLYTPARDVARSIRVNSTSKDTIFGSPRLRQHMFLDVKPVTTLLACENSSDIELVSRNPRRQSNNSTIHDGLEGEGYGHLRVGELNPILNSERLLFMPANPQASRLSFDWRKVISWPNKAWRHTLVTNPPAVQLMIYKYDWWKEGYVEVPVINHNGVTMGMLFDAIQKHHIWEQPAYFHASDCILGSDKRVQDAA